YRHYQNAWLLAWTENDTQKVPRGVLRFYHDDAGLGAGTEFEISPEARRRKLVTKLDQRTADGQALYLIRVPIDTDAFDSFRDPRQRVISLELTKPAALLRSYPDPIYTGYHPAGPASSIHVVGITLEEAPFGFEANPHKLAHVFERPEVPGYTVTVTNCSRQKLAAQVTLRTKSYDGQEQHRAQGKVSVAPGASADVELNFDLERNGWHEIEATVRAAGVAQETTLSLLVLPPNTRTYGYASNETRFGLWMSAGTYGPFRVKHYEQNVELLGLLRKLGIRRAPVNEPFFKPGTAQQYGFLPVSPHTYGSIVWDPFLNRDKDPAAWQQALERELAVNLKPYAGVFPENSYYYGGEWGIGGMDIGYAPWPRYTGDGDRDLTAAERRQADEQNAVLSAIGRAIREQYPDTKLYLQWGSPLGTIAHMKSGFPRELVDGYGMDVPMFLVLPERPNIDNSFQALWELREEAKHLGWPHLPIGWCEGPFLPTLPGLLTEREQMDHLVRIWLGALAFGVEVFDCSIQDFDRADYYGGEHYWSGIFRRRPYLNPKPSAAAVATATTMLCGADPVGGIDTGCLTTYCLAFQRAKTKEMIYALWRVRGTVEATVKVRGQQAVVTDAMGNARKLPVKDGTVRLTINSSPLWLTGVDRVEGFQFNLPSYESAPAKITRPLAEMTAKNWAYDGAEDPAYASGHRAVRRVTDPNLTAEFGAGETGHPDAVAITLAEEPGDRPLANRYGALVAKKPILIPGKAAALGLWIKGNSSWGRVAFQLRDAQREIWTSTGTKDAWSCDDTLAWSFVAFEGWRYVRFPLPGNHPDDAARELESTWWGSRGGDGIVDLPLQLEKIFVEACNEAPYLGEMKLVKDRSYKLAGLVAEYAGAADATSAAIDRYNFRRPVPAWTGPTANPIARLAADGVGEAPAIREFAEPLQGKDGRSMIIHFQQQSGRKYNLYLARYPDGRGAELLAGGVTDGRLISGLRPDTDLYLFLTAVGADHQESKPSPAFKLVTRDRFLQK
ncbi:hypothetical protein HQ590_01450, partial [bacterium]|nr:hypothetical protein [bacterium]